MKRASIIFVAGLLLAATAYCGFYFLGTAADRDLAGCAVPELAWLKKEFHLSDAEFVRISELHAAYRPHCAEMCRRIAAKDAELQALLATNTSVTPEIKIKLAEAAQIRADCQAAMLAHFFEVSRSMPPAEGKRYLEWVEEKTFGCMQSMPSMSEASPNDSGQH
jgi:hypothetical protein